MNSFRKHLRNQQKDELDHEKNSKEEVTSFCANLSDDTNDGDCEFDSQVSENSPSSSTQSCFSSE